MGSGGWTASAMALIANIARTRTVRQARRRLWLLVCKADLQFQPRMRRAPSLPRAADHCLCIDGRWWLRFSMHRGDQRFGPQAARAVGIFTVGATRFLSAARREPTGIVLHGVSPEISLNCFSDRPYDANRRTPSCCAAAANTEIARAAARFGKWSCAWIGTICVTSWPWPGFTV